ncbi:hypothetical protein CTheo_8503 [Ceratobasidium theobromae]|uniref:Uncharacterized protein n=1 Tax=Ceratobasidium theobromae TaxID=1582974 RepID=A0A5N5Q9H1_9AGAM|nr:hypothetical protein CTheo_8503 [Ceratobasidium theobromae]
MGVTVNIKHGKGFNTTNNAGKFAQFKLDPVTKVHNLWFNTGTHMLLYLLMQNALEGCQTLSDIIHCPYKEFQIKQSMLNKPLFLEQKAKGEGLGTAAANAHGLTESFQALGNAVGIPGVTAHAIRCETGNKFGLTLGAEAAQALLGHQEADSTFATHYLKKTLNLPVTQVALGMLDNLVTIPNQIALKCHSKSQLAAKALIWQKGTQTGDVRKQVLMDQEVKAAQNHPSVVAVDQKLGPLQKTICSLGLECSSALRKVKKPLQHGKKKALNKMNQDVLLEMADIDHANEEIEKLAGFSKGLLSKTFEDQDTHDEAEEEVVSFGEGPSTKGSKAKSNGGKPKQVFQERRINPFKDIEELEILDANLKEVKITFKELLLEPFIIDRIEQKIVEEHDGKWPCLLCIKLPPELKPRSGGTSVKFPNKAKLTQHLNNHTQWFKLMEFMFTNSPSEFKCPLEGCQFCSSMIPLVQKHCLDTCQDCEIFQALKAANDACTAPKCDKTDLNRRKEAVKLMGTGLPIPQWELDQIRLVAGLDKVKARELALKSGIDPDNVEPYVDQMCHLCQTTLAAIPEDGLVKDPNANKPLKEITKEVLTVEMVDKINAYINQLNLHGSSNDE